MRKLITAKEAREMIRTLPSDEEIAEINQEILDACNRGQCFVMIYRRIYAPLYNHLIKNGYEVTNIDNHVEIAW